MHIKENISIKHLNTFGIDVSARFYIEITGISMLQELLLHSQYLNTPKLILGGGSNILFTKDYEGMIIHMKIDGVVKLNENEDFVWLNVGAGMNWHSFVLYCIEHQYGGIENLSLIPGTVGAAPIQNIGAYGVEVKEVFEELEAIDRNTGEKKIFTHNDCEFGYRYSVFKGKEKDKYIITKVTFRLNKNPGFNTSYGAIKDTLDEMGIEKVSLKSISDAVIKIRESKLPDPNKIGNAGSFFKNPVIDKIDFEGLKAEFPNIKGYEQKDKNWVKVPAGWLIEQAGWKGKTFDQIGVHKDQALVLVNYGGGKGENIKKLANDIKKSVADTFGVELEPEVNMI